MREYTVSKQEGLDINKKTMISGSPEVCREQIRDYGSVAVKSMSCCAQEQLLKTLSEHKGTGPHHPALL